MHIMEMYNVVNYMKKSLIYETHYTLTANCRHMFVSVDILLLFTIGLLKYIILY